MTYPVHEAQAVFLDVETLRLSTDPGMSWGDPGKFGLACAVTWSEADGFRDWVGDEPDAPSALVAYLREGGIVVGHNIVRFDFLVIAAAAGLAPGVLAAALRGRVVATWACVRAATGRMVGLDALARGTLHRGKTGDGADAPRLWAAGRRAEVLAYCANDVRLLRDVFFHGERFGALRYSADGVAKSIRIKWRAR